MTHAIKTILLVDDEKRLLNSMAQRLALLGLEALRAVSGAQALELVRSTRIDLAIVDYKLPDMDGLTTITRLKEVDPDLKTILLTGYGSAKTRRASRELGSEYFEKDAMGGLWDLIKQMDSQASFVMMNSPNELPESHHPVEHLAASLDTGSVHQENPASSLVSQVDALPRFIGETPDMQRLRKEIKRLADLNCTVCIRGEAGTGKELAARSIHRLSWRRHQRFLAFNCGCFSDDFQFEELLEAIDPGTPFAGTIFLDHVEAMPAPTQEELIKLLTDKPGGHAGDIRFIVASHQDLNSRAAQGRFSRKLLNKLSVIGLAIPPLRERREDIYPLSAYFLKTFNLEFNKEVQSISDEVLSLFMAYPFPGNVRELKYIIERAVILADGPVISPVHLPERFVKKPLRGIDGEGGAGEQHLPTLGELEKRHIRKALEITRGNKSKASEVLGISRAALWRKLKLMDEKKK